MDRLILLAVHLVPRRIGERLAPHLPKTLQQRISWAWWQETGRALTRTIERNRVRSNRP